MKKVMMSIICLSMIFILGMIVFENSYAANSDQEVILSPTPVKDDIIIEENNTDITQECPYNHENCDGIHKNCNRDCLTQINKTDSTQTCLYNHENCNGTHQNDQCDNTRKQGNSSTRGKHHRNSN